MSFKFFHLTYFYFLLLLQQQTFCRVSGKINIKPLNNRTWQKSIKDKNTILVVSPPYKLQFSNLDSPLLTTPCMSPLTMTISRRMLGRWSAKMIRTSSWSTILELIMLQDSRLEILEERLWVTTTIVKLTKPSSGVFRWTTIRRSIHLHVSLTIHQSV